MERITQVLLAFGIQLGRALLALLIQFGAPILALYLVLVVPPLFGCLVTQIALGPVATG